MHTSGISVSNRDQVLAFRLDSHNLAKRLPAGSICAAAGACGVQNTPPGSLALSLHARVTDLAPSDVNRALVDDKTLLQSWSLRASPHAFPTQDAAVFTLGLLPVDEDSIRFFIRGVEPALDKVGISVTEVVQLTAAALYVGLDGRSLTKNQLGRELAVQMAPHLTAQQLAAWQSASWYATDQSLGESIVRFALPIVALQGLCCHADRRGNQAYLSRVDRWLGAPVAAADRQRARAELVRRYLHCYGPSTVEHYAVWAGIAPTQAAQAWGLVQRELVEVSFAGHEAWLHQQDIERFTSPPVASGIRFLPPYDSYLQLRDRRTLIPERELQRRIWRYAGKPGVVLADGQVVATWRSRKKGKGLHVSVELLTMESQSLATEIEAEAMSLAPFRRCASAKVVLTRAISAERTPRV